MAAEFDAKCSFCRKFSADLEVEWYDRTLHSHESSIVVPGVGPFSEGYVLILPREHYTSLSEMPDTKLADVDGLAIEVANVMGDEFGPTIAYEHGPTVGGRRGGGCIDHAHLHIMHAELEMLPSLLADNELQTIHSLSDLPKMMGQAYIYYRSLGGLHFAGPADVPSQYMRRKMATMTNVEDLWDYLVAPNYDLVTSMISRLTPWPLSHCTDELTKSSP